MTGEQIWDAYSRACSRWTGTQVAPWSRVPNGLRDWWAIMARELTETDGLRSTNIKLTAEVVKLYNPKPILDPLTPRLRSELNAARDLLRQESAVRIKAERDRDSALQKAAELEAKLKEISRSRIRTRPTCVQGKTTRINVVRMPLTELQIFERAHRVDENEYLSMQSPEVKEQVEMILNGPPHPIENSVFGRKRHSRVL